MDWFGLSELVLVVRGKDFETPWGILACPHCLQGRGELFMEVRPGNPLTRTKTDVWTEFYFIFTVIILDKQSATPMSFLAIRHLKEKDL